MVMLRSDLGESQTLTVGEGLGHESCSELFPLSSIQDMVHGTSPRLGSEKEQGVHLGIGVV